MMKGRHDEQRNKTDRGGGKKLRPGVSIVRDTEPEPVSAGDQWTV